MQGSKKKIDSYVYDVGLGVLDKFFPIASSIALFDVFVCLVAGKVHEMILNGKKERLPSPF